MAAKKDTKFRPCRAGCGATIWSATRTTCPACKAFRANVAARNAEAAKRERAVKRLLAPGKGVRYGAAYTRGLGVIRNLGR